MSRLPGANVSKSICFHSKTLTPRNLYNIGINARDKMKALVPAPSRHRSETQLEVFRTNWDTMEPGSKHQGTTHKQYAGFSNTLITMGEAKSMKSQRLLAIGSRINKFHGFKHTLERVCHLKDEYGCTVKVPFPSHLHVSSSLCSIRHSPCRLFQFLDGPPTFKTGSVLVPGTLPQSPCLPHA